jgi:hypothetical protein
MAEALTPEQSARKILAVLRAEGCQAGQGAQFSSIQMKFLNDGGSNAEMQAGLMYAGEKDWIAEGDPGFILLTDNGFGEA